MPSARAGRSIDLELSVMHNMLYHAALHGIGLGEARRRARRLLARIGLEARARDKVRKLSGGQMRRVEIARALLHRPRLLLLDEPTVGLDIAARQSLIREVRRLVDEEGLGVLWATHLIDEIEPGDRVTDAVAGPAPRGLPLTGYAICLAGIVWREGLRFVQQRGRFLSALVRPLVWLFIFAAGFRAVLGVSIIPPYETYVLYEVYVTPGLVAMIQLFNGLQSSLSMVYDREVGAMRILLVSPFPRWFLLTAKLLAGVAVSLLQVYVFLGIAWFWEIQPPPLGYVAVLPALVLTGVMLGAMGLLLSSLFRQLENFASVMNFVIFPMFFASSALYPLWRIREANALLYEVCRFNPFTHAVELIRFALYERIDWTSLAVVAGAGTA